MMMVMVVMMMAIGPPDYCCGGRLPVLARARGCRAAALGPTQWRRSQLAAESGVGSSILAAGGRVGGRVQRRGAGQRRVQAAWAVVLGSCVLVANETTRAHTPTPAVNRAGGEVAVALPPTLLMAVHATAALVKQGRHHQANSSCDMLKIGAETVAVGG